MKLSYFSPFKVFVSIVLSVILSGNTAYSWQYFDTIAVPKNVLEALPGEKADTMAFPKEEFSSEREVFKQNCRRDMKSLMLAIFFIETVRPWRIPAKGEKSEPAFKSRIIAAVKPLKPLIEDPAGKQLLQVFLEKDKIKRIGEELEGLELPFDKFNIRIFNKDNCYTQGAKKWEEIGECFFKIVPAERIEEAGAFNETERKKMDLLEQVKVPDPEYEPEEFALYLILRQISKFRIKEAVRLFLTEKGMKGPEENKRIAVSIGNAFIARRVKNSAKGEELKIFIEELNRAFFEFMPGGDEMVQNARDVQLILGQAVTIMSWIDRMVPWAGNIRLTAEEDKMVTSKKGKSFIDKSTLPTGVNEVKEEGAAGFFWRGTEGVKKIGENIIEDVIDKKSGSYKRLALMREQMILYLMDHGFISVPGKLKQATDSKRITTIHETAFLNDLLPLSSQATSTGPGHFQGNSLDIKYVTGGRGLQINVLYNNKNEIVDVLLQRLHYGSWTLALPGYVDYMVNLGGLRFNDISVALTDGEAAKFNPKWEEIKNAEIKPEVAPVMALKLKDGGSVLGWKLIRNRKAEDVEIRELSQRNYEKAMENKLGLAHLYQWELSDGAVRVDELVRVFAQASERSVKEAQPIDVPFYGEDKVSAVESEEVSFNMRSGIDFLISHNEKFLETMFKDETKISTLLRIAVETLEQNKGTGMIDFLKDLGATSKFHIQLYSTQEPLLEVQQDVYDKYGFPVIKAEDLKNRTRANTLTVLPVEKGETFSQSEANVCWTKLGKLSPGRKCTPGDTIILPVGYNYDQAGVVRSILLGLRLCQISDKKYTQDNPFVAETYQHYRMFCLAQGLDEEQFTLTKEDIYNLAGAAGIKEFTSSLNILIRFLPILPYNVEEMRDIHERAREVLIRA